MEANNERRRPSCEGLACSGEQRRRLRVIQRAMKAITGKWKGEILSLLIDGPMRFNALRRGIPLITQHMLAAQLRDLESAGLVVRHVYDEVPPRVEYEMSEAGLAFRPVAEALHTWAERYLPPEDEAAD